ncbi:hypothetical protein [Marinibactrum halimedae]|uniref:Uncharacterized protein n=1 Tax=Marinibactrum halimedae TaxID=1444977 RepID=A0AA37WQ77_9GAMM|nr:hypothetical protein [Marinibactrum halimedae]MCD9461380.1 hypothetical protein [Marinibactrum halimedae]GLS27786.1 hypothetical protein GCM10007877_35050 [Marinibactrum halimedae]
MRFLVSIAILLISNSSIAGTASGQVTEIIAHTDGGNGHGVFMFYIEGQRDNTPPCSTVGGGKAWAMSLEKESGRAMYSLLLSAQAQGKTVSVFGRGNCDSWGDREEPHYINLIN